METNETHSKAQESGFFRLFDKTPSSGLGFFDGPEKSLEPPPLCAEVIPSKDSRSVAYTLEPVIIDGLTLVKGRVSTKEVFALPNADLVPGKYEGGLKLWEGSLDLITALSSEIRDDKLSFTGKRVLELGCGHGLPGIFACQKGATVVHFQDFNAEVLQYLTIPNVDSNIPTEEKHIETRFFAGDWGEVQNVLPYVHHSEHAASQESGYDVILMAETVYSISSLPNLYKLIKKCLRNPHGVVYMAAKKYYFGVGGGSRRFLSVVERDGAFNASLIAEVADGSSNVREVWKFLPK